MKKPLLISILIIAVLVAGFYILNNHIYQEKQGIGVPTFSWRFEEAETLNGDGNPNTNVFLDLKYPGGEVKSRLIQVSHGSCNILPDAQIDSTPGTTNIQCYGAGFGYRFKIVTSENSYLVMRQEFDEGSPDYNPPIQEYKVVLEIPLN